MRGQWLQRLKDDPAARGTPPSGAPGRLVGIFAGGGGAALFCFLLGQLSEDTLTLERSRRQGSTVIVMTFLFFKCCLGYTHSRTKKYTLLNLLMENTR